MTSDEMNEIYELQTRMREIQWPALARPATPASDLKTKFAPV
jgi:hypothetical protein